MKYLISQEQQKVITDNMAEVIKSQFSESTWICDVVAFPTETDEDEAIFDVYIYLKLSELKKFNEAAQNSISLSIKHKVMEFVETWFPFKPEEIFVGTLAADC